MKLLSRRIWGEEKMLNIKNLCAFYGSIQALYDIDIEVQEGTIVCLIGANGAGKTSLLKSISGMVQHSGTIEWNGEDITNYNSVQIARRGIMHVPEGRHVFPGLTVEENLEVGTINWRGFFGKRRDADELTYVYDMFPRLKERRKQISWSLSGGEQQMLAIGRALMGRPKILLLDEPSMGLAPLVIEELFEKIVAINKKGTPILMVEQNASMALEISDYAYVINQGSIEISGAAKDVACDDRVINAYLGVHAGQC